tara:strand:- start:317 stop:1645 length:1329 start_codon:yes stop_codon:yes gene_type:complete
MKKIDIHILGGGPAGMASAYYSNKYNLSFKVFESSNFVGGNCRTLEMDGFKFDTGAHRFHDKISEVTDEIKKLLGNNLNKVSAPSKIYWNNQFINFPLQISELLGVLDSATTIKIIKEILYNQLFRFKKNNNFKEFAFNKYGKTISDLFLINYTEKLWGTSSDMLSTKVSGGRLNNLNLFSILKESIFSSNSFNHLDGSFYYPRNGYGEIFDSIKHNIGEKNIEFNSSIIKLIHNNKKITKIITKENSINAANNIISSLPINTIINILDPKPPLEIQEIISQLSFRSLKLCIFLIDKNSISNNASIYFPSKEIPFTRLYEPKNRSKYLTPSNQTSIVVEVPYFANSSKNTMDDMLIDNIKLFLTNNNFFNKNEIISSKIINIPYAYPVIKKDITKKINLVINYLKRFDNLYLLGRSAEFKYLHTHDLFHQSNQIIKLLLKRN